jgi:hypothetical protein
MCIEYPARDRAEPLVKIYMLDDHEGMILEAHGDSINDALANAVNRFHELQAEAIKLFNDFGAGIEHPIDKEVPENVS